MNIKLLWLIPISCCVVSASLYAQNGDDKVHNVAELQAFSQQQKQILDKQTQEQEAFLEKKREQNLKIQQLAEKSRATNNSDQTTSTTNNNTQLPTCDCDNPNDQYNYPSNFQYNYKHEKILRLSPTKCICKKSKTATTIETDQPSTTQSNGSTNSKNWGIRY